MIALLQARTVLAWLRNLQDLGISLSQVEIVPRANAEAALTAIGGTGGPSLLARARDVELAIYQISAALMPPDIKDVDRDAAAVYRPFDVIESVRITDSEGVLSLRPLAIFDDAHGLHPQQLDALTRWLSRRELKVARWVLTRLDALTPTDVLLDRSADIEEPGLKRGRDITGIWMQSGEQCGNQRRAFRKMAKDMAGRYLSQIEVFNRRRLHSLGDLLSTTPEVIAPGKRTQLAEHIARLQRRYGISAERRRSLESEVDAYLAGAGEKGEDVRLAILGILFECYAKRIPQRGLFEEIADDAEPSRPLTVDAGVADGARIHLLHKHDRPYFFGIDAVCDASSENAEQFLQLAARLVSQSETQLIRRGRDAMLTSNVQHKLLRERAR
jgi:hypothetical protein